MPLFVQIVVWVSFLAGVLLLLAGYRLRQADRPVARVMYVDKQVEHLAVTAPMAVVRARMGATPDGLVRLLRQKRIAPMVFGGSQAPHSIPFPLQMKAGLMCWLTEQVYRQPAPEALLRYEDMDLLFARTPETDTLLLEVIRAMRASAGDDLDRSHEDPALCQVCPVREMCSQSLV